MIDLSFERFEFRVSRMKDKSSALLRSELTAALHEYHCLMVNSLLRLGMLSHHTGSNDSGVINSNDYYTITIDSKNWKDFSE